MGRFIDLHLPVFFIVAGVAVIIYGGLVGLGWVPAPAWTHVEVTL